MADQVDGVALVKYVVRECHDFFSHLLATVNEASEKGDIPHPTFRQVVVDANGTHLTVDEAADGTKKILKKDRVKRKPNAFNIFVKKKCDQIRASGTDSNNAAVFVQASVAWKQLSEEQKQAYIARFTANNEDPELDNLPEPESPANGEQAPTADKKKRKKEKEEGNAAGEVHQPEATEADLQKKRKRKKKGTVEE